MSVNVLANGRRVPVKVTPNTTMQEVSCPLPMIWQEFISPCVMSRCAHCIIHLRDIHSSSRTSSSKGWTMFRGICSSIICLSIYKILKIETMRRQDWLTFIYWRLINVYMWSPDNYNRENGLDTFFRRKNFKLNIWWHLAISLPPCRPY